MTKKEFLELFSEVDEYGYRYSPLNEEYFSISYRVSTDEFHVNYQQDFEGYDGYITESADDDLRITFKIALQIYELDSSPEGY